MMGRLWAGMLLTVFSVEAATVVKEYRYMASDTDSKVSARKAALQTVQNLVMEELGTGVSTRFEKDQKIEDKQMQQQLRIGVKNFASGFIQSKVLDENWDGTSYWIKASVNMDETGLYEKVMQQYAAMMAGAKSRQLEAMLADISTPEKQQALIKEAITHPFSDDEHGAVHLKILKSFERYGIYDAGYREFLITTLGTIEYPSWDSRTAPILTHLEHFPAYTKQERAVLLGILLNIKVGDGGDYLASMLKPMVKQCDAGASELMESYIDAIRDGRAGLPVYTNMGKELSGIIYGWAEVRNAACPLPGGRILLDVMDSDDAKAVSFQDWVRVLESLIRIARKDSGVSAEMIAPYFKEAMKQFKADRYGKQMVETIFKGVDQGIRADLAAELTDEIRRIYTPQEISSWEVLFFVKLGVTIPDKVFGVREYYKQVKDAPDSTKRQTPVEAIAAYGDANGGKNRAEFMAVMRDLDSKRDHYLADKLVPVMEQIGYDDQESVNLLSRFIASDNPNISRKAQKMLLDTKQPAKRIRSVVTALAAMERKYQERLITFLLGYGRDAAAILPELEPYKARDKDLKYKVEWLEKQLKKKGYL